MIKVKPITAKDFETFYGKPTTETVRGLSFYDGDEIVGVGGVARAGLRQWLSVDIRRDDVAMKRALLIAWKQFQLMFKRPVYVAQEDLPTAEGFIKHFGFRHLHDNIWVY